MSLGRKVAAKRIKDVFLKIGILREERGMLLNALDAYKSALNLEVDQEQTYCHIAWCFYKMNQIDKCKESIEKVEEHR